MFSPMRKKGIAIQMLVWMLVVIAILVIIIIIFKKWDNQINVIAGGINS